MVSELIAWKPENGEFSGTFLLDGFVEFFEAGELRREAAFGGCVDDEDDFALVIRQRVGVSFLYFASALVSSKSVRAHIELVEEGRGGGRTVRRRKVVESSRRGHCLLVIESDESAV